MTAAFKHHIVLTPSFWFLHAFQGIQMKILTFFLVGCLCVGCTSTPPPPPEPKGEIKPVNPSEFKLSDLYIKQGDF
jgi:hypothetical protein